MSRTFLAAHGVETALRLPLMVASDQLIGYVAIWESRAKRTWPPDRVRLAQTLADRVATAIVNARLFGEVQKLAITDNLTGLHNRRYFLELAEHEYERARRYNRPLCAIMLDIDRFKQVNDSYGHAVGDNALRAVAQRCRQSLRDVDHLARVGGEEFTVLLPECTLDGAVAAAERLRRNVADLQIETHRGLLTMTISLGVATLVDDCPKFATLLDRSDTALYVAKKAGRNRVAIWRDDSRRDPQAGPAWDE